MENVKNEKTLELLQDGYNTCWDKFLYGDKASGTKPGNIYVYGAIAGIREVAKERMGEKTQTVSSGKEL